MGLGSTAKKVQLLAERAEQLYVQLNDLRDQINGLKQTVEHTGDQVDSIIHENERQRTLLEAIARSQDLDVEQILAEVEVEDDVTGVDADQINEPGVGDDNTVTSADDSDS